MTVGVNVSDWYHTRVILYKDCTTVVAVVSRCRRNSEFRHLAKTSKHRHVIMSWGRSGVVE